MELKLLQRSNISFMPWEPFQFVVFQPEIPGEPPLLNDVQLANKPLPSSFPLPKILTSQLLKSWSKFDAKHYDKILYGAQRFAEQSQNTEEKYIPHATTWLNQERWLDFFETDKYGCVIKAKPQKKINNLAG